MWKRSIVLMVCCFLIDSHSTAQCYARKGIMNEACKSMTIVKPPAFDVGIGLSNAHVLKVDMNYITENEFVYGGAVGIRLNKPELSVTDMEDATFNAFLGYNVVGCIIVGVTAGVSHYTADFMQNDKQIRTSGFKQNIGMSIKLIANFTPVPITFGCYGSRSGIGMSVGTIF